MSRNFKKWVWTFRNNIWGDNMPEKKVRRVYQAPSIPPLYKQVGIYARVSTRSPEQMNSLAAQVSELVRMFRADYTARIYDVYIDIVSGARTENRPAYQRMFNDCRNRKLDLIVCKSISRFGRNTEEMLVSLREIKACGVNVFFQLENLNTADSSSEHILTVIEAFYQAENQARSDNIKLSLRNSAATGKSKNYTRPCYGLQRDEHGELTVNEADAANVQLIFDAYLQGATIKQIVDLLKDLHIPSPTGKEKWCQKSIDDILSNEKYVGDVVLMKTIRIGGPGSKRIKNRGEAAQYKATASHQAIITREQFEAAQRERERRCNVEGNGAQRVRKSTRYKSTFSIDKYLSTMEE